MGELVSGAATLILEKLASKAFEEVSLGWGLKPNLKRLQGSMKIINDSLLDAESKQTEDEAITEWLKQLKDAFYDADDIVDGLECEALRNQVVETHAGIFRKVGRFFSSSNSLAFRYNMAQKIKDMKERIDEIASERIKFGLSQHHSDHMPLMPWRETHSFVQSSRVIGRDKEKEEIIRFLMSPQLWVDEIDVMPIVGIGGLGKTKLAQLVYNNEQVKEIFQIRMWVLVSDEFDLRRLTLEILKAANSTIPDHLNSCSLDQLQSLLRKELSAKKFLLVLDDVWNESPKRWHELRDLLMGTQNHSKILVTTRSHRVASTMGTVAQLDLEELGEEESMKLFVRCAFPTGEEKKHPTLTEMGKEIVKKCRGVPLAVETLGSLLYKEVNEKNWRKISDSEIWKIDQHQAKRKRKIDQHNDGIMPALRLSYNHLPTHSKQCFS